MNSCSFWDFGYPAVNVTKFLPCRNIQLTASASLGRVIQCTNIPLASSLPKLCPRVVKSLSAPNFLAKAPLLDSVRSLIEARLLRCMLLNQQTQMVACLEQGSIKFEVSYS